MFKTNTRRIMMALTLFATFACSATTAESEPKAKSVSEYDVVVYGGTSAGIIAAIQAKKMGKRVVLLEQTIRVGGLTTGGLGATDCFWGDAIGGLSRSFYEGLCHEPRVALAVLDLPACGTEGLPVFDTARRALRSVRDHWDDVSCRSRRGRRLRRSVPLRPGRSPASSSDRATGTPRRFPCARRLPTRSPCGPCVPVPC